MLRCGCASPLFCVVRSIAPSLATRNALATLAVNPLMIESSLLHAPQPGEQPALKLSGLSPYWMDRATCALNPVQLRGIYLLTAPNMSGKSTLMRSVLVAALLANCGLCVPCDSAVVPR
jgi:DNA mismatch repair ATPase MutS